MKTIRNFLRRFRKDEGGYSSVELVICATTFLSGFFWVFETGLIMTKKMMLERALDITVRELRLTSSPLYTHDYIKDQICARAVTFKDCDTSLLLEMSPVDLDVGFTRSAQCIDRANDITPVTSWEAGMENEVVYVRACIIIDPMMPNGIALFPGVTESGIPLFADTAFVNEPT